MIIIENSENYIRAAKIIASCPKSRLPYVLSVLKQGGIDIDEREVETLICPAMSKERTASLSARRAEKSKDRWKQTDNEVILALRTAYDNGVSFTALGRKIGIHKATLYRYMWGERTPTTFDSKLIMDELITN